jgi:hypothetical protein
VVLAGLVVQIMAVEGGWETVVGEIHIVRHHEGLVLV